ncbi:unnamed protein product [Rhizophagus irregularis]|nr:unnamed protein product [Rhizophagus irregularis]
MQRLKLLLIWVSTISTEIVIDLPTLESQSLNENQIIIYKRIESHYATLLTNPECVDLVKLIVMGTAGTGNLI